jgi:hypothetical protein
MIPLASNSACPFPEAEFRGKAFWAPPVRQTGFLHPAAMVSLDTTSRGCPRAKFALSTLSTDSRVSTKVVRRGKKATTRGVGSG